MWIALCIYSALVTLAADWFLGKWRRAKADADFFLAMVDQLRSDAMAAEARARGVGGSGEHAGHIITTAGHLSPFMVEATRILLEGQGNRRR